MREILHLLPRPSHYAGIEDGICLKNSARLRIALAFPDLYEVGMSYLGQKILYGIVNARDGWQAERVMAPDAETCAILRGRGAPLTTLETDTPLASLAAVCFSVTHELCYTDILNMLDLAHIPIWQKDRSQNLLECPIIMAGGGAMLGAECISPFLDLAALGDGEELLPELLEVLEAARKEGLTRDEFLLKAARIPGVYVPSIFEPGQEGRLEPKIADYRPTRRIVTDLENCVYPTSQVVPVGAVQNRLSLEIARGCARGCRFCHAGMIYRPVRERDPKTVAHLLEECLKRTGFDEVSFLSLSAGDCTALATIHSLAYERCQREQITLSLPSLRVGSVDDNVMAKMAALKRHGCTLAPEAGSQRLRDVINKGISEEDLLLHLQKLLEHGWRQVKLYFMIGLPTETDEDLEAIAELARKARDVGGPGAPRMQITVAISPFVPKPFTPFQWEEQIGLNEISRRVNLLRGLFKGVKNVKLKWHSPETSHLEGILSRGGRELAPVIEKAWRKGAIFCGWAEHFKLEPWLEALEECGLNAADCIAAREIDSILPWEHIEAGVTREFLLRERSRAYNGKITEDCRMGPCGMCGSCDGKQPAKVAHDGKAGHKLVFPQRDQEACAPSKDEAGRLILREYKNEKPQLNPQLAARACYMRLWHVKTGGCAFLSHLELQAVLSRAARRAGVPVAFSQGFHPLPLISFGRALPVGAESQAEWFAMGLHSRMSPAKLVAMLNPFLHEGLRIGYAELAEKKMEQAIAEVFALDLPGESMLEAADRFAKFIELDSVMLTRQTKKGEKTVDIRPLLLNWKVSLSSGENRLIFSADWSEEYLSPVALARAILDFPADYPLRIVKLRQIFANGAEYCSLGKIRYN